MKTKIQLLSVLILLFFSCQNTQAQISWTKYNQNPVYGWGSQPSVIFENDTFKMWFAYGIVDNIPPDSLKIVVGYATSTDGINWTDYSANPVFDAESDSSWDSRVHDTPFVLHDSSGYKMWYTGSDHIGYPWADSLVMVIGYATSPDGINWTKYPDPVLTKGPSGSWERLWLESPSVIYENGEYKMWYTGESTETGSSLSQVGYATSPDGINWTKYPGNPVLEVDQTNDYIVGISSVVKVDSTYFMFYNGATQADAIDGKLDSATVNLAYSDDGINWTKYYANPLMTPVYPGIDGDTIKPWAPAVVFKNDTFYMWYEGICLATSPLTFTNITNRKQKNDIYLYPNPVTNTFIIKQNNLSEVAIYSLQGVLLRKIPVASSANPIKIDVSDLPKGVYIVVTHNKQGEKGKFKLIKL